MADKSQQYILDALRRAVATPDGSPLFGSKNSPGLFANSAAARQAAQQCKDRGYLQVIRQECKGKSTNDICAITDLGIELLLDDANPKETLQSLVETLGERRQQMDQLIGLARSSQQSFDTLRQTTEKVLQRLEERGTTSLSVPTIRPPSPNGNGDLVKSLLDYLEQWRQANSLGDCPLPDLYRAICLIQPSTSIGKFHDGLRKLNEEKQVYLHPWTGPLYEMPEPTIALMVGHEIAYYASLRTAADA